MVSGGGVWTWYKHRYKRILVPYLLIMICVYVALISLGKETLGEALLNISTINFWLSHNGAWFVAMLIPLYAITPLHYVICKKIKHPVVYNLILIALLIVLMSINLSCKNGIIDNILGNVQFVSYHLPAFFIGFILAPMSKENKSLSLLYLIVVPIVLIVAMRLLHFGYWPGFIAVPLVVFLCWLFNYCSAGIKKMFDFFGTISLESYLFNGTLGAILMSIFPKIYASSLNYGCYLHYAMVIVLGTTLAYLVHRLCDKYVFRIK